jgi:hypothetical protein
MSTHYCLLMSTHCWTIICIFWWVMEVLCWVPDLMGLRLWVMEWCPFCGHNNISTLSLPFEMIIIFMVGETSLYGMERVFPQYDHTVLMKLWEKREIEEGKGYCRSVCHYFQSKDRSWFIVDGQRMYMSSDANSASRSPDQTCWSWNSNIYYHIITPAYILTTACVIQ